MTIPSITSTGGLKTIKEGYITGNSATTRDIIDLSGIIPPSVASLANRLKKQNSIFIEFEFNKGAANLMQIQVGDSASWYAFAGSYDTVGYNVSGVTVTNITANGTSWLNNALGSAILVGGSLSLSPINVSGTGSLRGRLDYYGSTSQGKALLNIGTGTQPNIERIGFFTNGGSHSLNYRVLCEG